MRPLQPDYFVLLQVPSQCIWPYFVQTTVLMAKAIIERDPVVEPNDAPPVPNNELYTAINVAISVRVRRRNTIFPTTAQGVNVQQDFIEIRGNIHNHCMFFVLFGNTAMYPAYTYENITRMVG